MGFNCGIIGLPNVGKSTIFNALSGASAQMANYPFCTIEPNRGIVPVPDERLTRIAELLKKDNPVPTRIEFIDVAGLVKGASKGEGLGNKFLGHIRTVDALVHIVRCFASEEVAHAPGELDPIRDIDIVNTELILADIEVLERARDKEQKLAKSSGDKKATASVQVLDRVISSLNEGNEIRTIDLSEDEILLLDQYGLITDKPIIYCANVGENDDPGAYMKKIDGYTKSHGAKSLYIVGKLEEEISELPADEKVEYLEAMGLPESGLDRLIRTAYDLLDLITYYTAETDLQAWTVRTGTPASQAAGKIHTDFERGFIRAEVFTFDDLGQCGSEQAVRDKGLLRSEGRDYIVKDGDIVRYLFNV